MSGNCSAARAKGANEPAICVSGPRCYMKRMKPPLRSGFVGHSPATSEKRIPINGSDKVVPGGNAKAAFAKMSARSNLVSIVNVGDDMNHNTDAFSSFYATLQFFRKQP